MRAASAALLFALASAFAANPPVTFTFNAGPSCFGQCLGGATQIRAIAVDTAGNTYLTGNTNGTIPVTADALQPSPVRSTCNGIFLHPSSCNDAFVIKLDPSGAILYATYFGGDGDDWGQSIALDRDGNIYVAGSTGYNLQLADNFPATPGAPFSTVPKGETSGFLVKLSADGKLVYSTLLPGALQSSNVIAMAIDSAHNAYVAYQSDPKTLIATTSGAFQSQPQNDGSPIVLKFNESGSAVLYATYLSGTGPKGTADFPVSVALDSSGNLLVAGYTSSANFPVTAGAFQTKNPDPEYVGFISKLNTNGTGLVFSTYLGGGAYDQILQMKVDSQGEIYVLGYTNSPNFPVTTSAFPFTKNSGVLAHLSADGSSLISATFLPPASAFDLDSLGNALVVGTDRSKTTPPYVARISSSGQLTGMETFGGRAPRVFSNTDTDTAAIVSVTSNGSVVLCGSAISDSFPGIPPPATNQPVAYAINFFINPTAMNAASFVSREIAPGELIAIRGYGFPLAAGETTPANSKGLLPTTYAGLSALFDEIAAPLLYVQSQQINVQVPWEVAGRTSVQMRIQIRVGPSPGDVGTLGPYPMTVAPTAPGIFTINNSNATRNSPTNPAQAGDFVTIYGTGGGVNDMGDISGGFWPLTTPLPRLKSNVSLTIGAETLNALYAGASPASPSGVFQINFRLPADFPAGTSPLTLTIGDASTPAGSITVSKQR